MESRNLTSVCIGLPYVNGASPNMTLRTNTSLDELNLKVLPHFESDYFHCQEPQVLKFEQLRAQKEDALWNFMMRNKLIFQRNPILYFSYNDCNSQSKYSDDYKTDLSPCITFFLNKLQEHHIINKTSNWGDKLGIDFNPDRPLTPLKSRTQRLKLWIKHKFQNNPNQSQYLSKFIK